MPDQDGQGDVLPDVAAEGETVAETELVVDIAGFEGPLDLLLHLARHQRVDLTQISILALAEQYLRFIEQAQNLRVEIAADYLVTASWLAFLKSKLLVPSKRDEDGESGEDLAAALQFRLQRLETMREAGRLLAANTQLGRDTYVRGAPEPIISNRTLAFEANLFNLLSAYAERRQRNAIAIVHIQQRDIYSLQEAREHLLEVAQHSRDWASLDQWVDAIPKQPHERASMIASTLAACLELAREGNLELRQETPLGPLFMRAAQENVTSADMKPEGETKLDGKSHG